MQKPRTKADKLAALTAGLNTTTNLPSAATPIAPAAASPSKVPNPAVNLRMPPAVLSRYFNAAAI